MVSSSEMTESAPVLATEMTTAVETENERIESSREVDTEKEENIRRQKKLEEALEAKSLRRIISAYLKYLTFLDFTQTSLAFILFRYLNWHCIGGFKENCLIRILYFTFIFFFKI